MMRDESNLPDHSPKYNLTDEELEKANQKMATQKPVANTVEEDLINLSEVKGPKDRPPIKVGNKLIHQRTDEEFDDIWNSFLINVAEEFQEFMGYSVKDIERIGIKKFIDAYDWCDGTDVLKFATDQIHIIPCIHCDDEFADVEESYGLCEKCLELYDLTFFDQVMSEASREFAENFLRANPNIKTAPSSKAHCITLFMYNKEFRDMFLKTTLELRKQMKQNDTTSPKH